MTIRLMWGYMPHNILFYLHFIYAASTHTTKISIILILHIYIINMNKKKDTSFTYNLSNYSNNKLPGPQGKGEKEQL